MSSSTALTFHRHPRGSGRLEKRNKALKGLTGDVASNLVTSEMFKSLRHVRD